MEIKKGIQALLMLLLLVVISQAQTNNVIKLNIDLKKEAQTISGFGASDAWGCQFVGQLWPYQKRIKIADWLFSYDTLYNGQPKGIGLSIWRFNIGGGTYEQGDSSDISDEWRRTECFLNSDGTYNWNKQAGQQWFLNAAKQRNVSKFIAFSNTPPVSLTKNGKGWSSGGSSINLQPEKITDFADFLAKVMNHFQERGINFSVLSPLNEPQWNWDGKGQEGTPSLNTEIYNVAKVISKKLDSLKLITEIEVPEAGQINYLFQDSTNLPGRDNQINCFFNPRNPLFIGSLPNISQSIAGHSYFTTYDAANMKNLRRQLHNKILAINKNLEYNMTEYCVLEDNKEIKGEGRDLGMVSALYIAKIIHYDLTFTNATSWQWWLAISPYDYKDGLVYIDKNKRDGNIYDSKMMWALGQYSRFINPGMKRVETTLTENETLAVRNNDILVSAYKTSDNKKIVAVIINLTENNKELSFDNVISAYKTARMFRTSEKSDENILPIGFFKPSDIFPITGHSISTIEFF